MASPCSSFRTRLNGVPTAEVLASQDGHRRHKKRDRSSPHLQYACLYKSAEADEEEEQEEEQDEGRRRFKVEDFFSKSMNKE